MPPPNGSSTTLRRSGVLGWEVAYQSETLDRYEVALERLVDRDLVFECYCSRRDIQDAARAPHAVPGHYPGTCRDLTDARRDQKRAELAAAGRVPALRLRAGVTEWTVRELFATEATDGRYTGDVDLVLRRGGQVTDHRNPAETGYAYNLAVVVDDALAGVDQVVRGDDLLSSTPRQAYLAHLLGLPETQYIHVPLVLGPTGERLAKRDGAVTLRELPGETVAEQAAVGPGVDRRLDRGRCARRSPPVVPRSGDLVRELTCSDPAVRPLLPVARAVYRTLRRAKTGATRAAAAFCAVFVLDATKGVAAAPVPGRRWLGLPASTSHRRDASSVAVASWRPSRSAR